MFMKLQMMMCVRSFAREQLSAYMKKIKNKYGDKHFILGFFRGLFHSCKENLC